jgi:hypothetical protein
MEGRGTLSVASRHGGNLVGKKGWIVLGVVVALLTGVVVYGYANRAESPEEVHARLAAMDAKLIEAGSARITFTGELAPQVAGPTGRWQGTTLMKFGAEPSWDTTYSTITADGQQPVQAREVHVGTDTFYNAPAVQARDGRPWLNARSTSVNWGSNYSSLAFRVTDFVLWREFFDNISVGHANQAKTEDLPDLPGAAHEYRMVCNVSMPQCPPPIGSFLDDVFNTANLTLSAWFDDDGLLRRMQMETDLFYLRDEPGGDPNVFHPSGEYSARATWDLSDFGTAVSVAAPPEDQVSESRTASVRDGS